MLAAGWLRRAGTKQIYDYEGRSTSKTAHLDCPLSSCLILVRCRLLGPLLAGGLLLGRRTTHARQPPLLLLLLPLQGIGCPPRDIKTCAGSGRCCRRCGCGSRFLLLLRQALPLLLLLQLLFGDVHVRHKIGLRGKGYGARACEEGDGKGRKGKEG